MTILVNDILKSLWAWAPAQLQENYDNSQIICGSPQQEVTGILVALDCIEEVVDDAVSKQCNCIVAHHPIVFTGLKSITGKNYVERTIIKAIKNNIAIIALHTNLDNVSTGVNFKIGELLQLQNLKILDPKPHQLIKLYTFVPEKHAEKVRQALFLAGAGNIGNYSHCSFNVLGSGTFMAEKQAKPFVGKVGKIHIEQEEKIEVIFPSYAKNTIISALINNHPYEEVAYDLVSLQNLNPNIGAGMVGEFKNSISETEFLSILKKVFRCGVVKHTKLIGKPVKKVAFCGGAGSFLLNRAKAINADFFVTSDVKYHEFFDAEQQLVFADIGHFESEQFTIDLIGDYLKENFNTFAIRFTEVNTNPVNYF